MSENLQYESVYLTERVTQRPRLQVTDNIQSGRSCSVNYNSLLLLTLESWFTNLEQTPLNRSQQLPAPYKRLIDGIKEN